MFSSSDN